MVNVKSLDLNEALNEEDKYDLVGVTFHSFSVRYARQIREHFKKAWLFCGGHHPSALPEQLLALGYDQVVIGEGENALIDIIHGDTERIKTSSTKHFETIDDIPYPDYTGLKYSDNIVISSRGCPFRCNFCASTAFWGNKWKARTAEAVIDEINTKGYKTWMFEDDNFTANKQRAIEICHGIKGSWQCAARAENLDEELCYNLKASGCHTVWIGVESFSQRSLDRCNKHTTVEKMRRGIDIAESTGLRTMCQFIVGLPDDTIDDIRLTARVISQTRMSSFGANIAWILPNTEIYSKAKVLGFDDNTYIDGGSLFYTYEQTMDTLQAWAGIINGAKNKH